MIRRLFYIFSRKSREEKVRKFLQSMKPQNSDLLLDAGGSSGKGFAGIWNSFQKVIVVDLNNQNLQIAKREYEHVRVLVGNVCNMPLRNKSVDFVFSNAVIEHIDKEKRYLFAEEIRRVARKGYFITTPNYWFPFEPHYIYPFWQYLPERLQRFLKRHFALGYYKKGFYEKIDLLKKKDLRNLFPEANILDTSINRIVSETLICCYKRENL